MTDQHIHDVKLIYISGDWVHVFVDETPVYQGHPWSSFEEAMGYVGDYQPMNTVAIFLYYNLPSFDYFWSIGLGGGREARMWPQIESLQEFKDRLTPELTALIEGTNE